MCRQCPLVLCRFKPFDSDSGSCTPLVVRAPSAGQISRLFLLVFTQENSPAALIPLDGTNNSLSLQTLCSRSFVCVLFFHSAQGT